MMLKKRKIPCSEMSTGFFLILSADSENHTQKGRKEFRAVHNNDFHKKRTSVIEESNGELLPPQEKEA